MLSRMYFTGNDGNQKVFATIFIPIILYSKKKSYLWISTGISSENIKPFYTDLEPTMSTLANCRVNVEFRNSALVQKTFSLLYSNFI